MQGFPCSAIVINQFSHTPTLRCVCLSPDSALVSCPDPLGSGHETNSAHASYTCTVQCEVQSVHNDCVWRVQASGEALVRPVNLHGSLLLDRKR